MRHFFAHVAGESYRNSDGTDRQVIIPKCVVGELLVLEHEPDNPADINAIRVLRETGEQIGYLTRELAGEVVSRCAKGWCYYGAVAGFGRAGGNGPYGVALLIVVDESPVDRLTLSNYVASILAERPAARWVTPVAAERDLGFERRVHRAARSVDPSESDMRTAWQFGAIILAVIVIAIVLLLSSR